MNLPDEITSIYNVIERLGGEEGGSVYLVEDLSAGGLYVIKELILPYYSASPKVQKIINEISSTGEMLMNFSCDGLTKFFDFIPFDGTYYFLMEYIKGDNLDSLCEKSRGFFPVQKVVSWAIKICNSLSYLHSNDFIFKDLKPGHIIIDKFGEPWLVDFGLSRYAGLNIKSLHISYNVPPYFSSPEHYDKQDITRVSDVYSLGATIYFILTESFPLDARERISGREQLEKPSELNENINDELDFIIMKSLSLNPDERYQTVYALKEDFEHFLAGREIFKGKMSSHTYHRKDEEILQAISEVATWGIEGNQRPVKKGLLRPKSNLLERAKSFPALKNELPDKDRENREAARNIIIEPHFIERDDYKKEKPLEETEEKKNMESSDYKEEKSFKDREEKDFTYGDYTEERRNSEDREEKDFTYGDYTEELWKRKKREKDFIRIDYEEERDAGKKREAFIKEKKLHEYISPREEQIPVMSLINKDSYVETEAEDMAGEEYSDDDGEKEEDFKKPLKVKSRGEDTELNDFHKKYSSAVSSVNKNKDIDLLPLEERLKQIQIADENNGKPGKSVIILCNIIAIFIILAVLYMFFGRILIAEWHFTRGKELLNRGNVPGSIVEFQHALEFKEFKNREIYFWIGKAYNLSGNWDDAKRYLNNYLDACPEGDFSGEAREILKTSE